MDAWLQNAKNHLQDHYNPAKPWNFYIDLDDGEYYSPLGAPVVVVNKRIINLIPYSVQDSTLPTSWLPTPVEMGSLIWLSNDVEDFDRKTFQEEMKEDVNMIFDYMKNVSQMMEVSLNDIHNKLKKLEITWNQFHTDQFTSYMDFHQNLID